MEEKKLKTRIFEEQQELIKHFVIALSLLSWNSKIKKMLYIKLVSQYVRLLGFASLLAISMGVHINNNQKFIIKDSS
jgi:hypothetical protein